MNTKIQLQHLSSKTIACIDAASKELVCAISFTEDKEMLSGIIEALIREQVDMAALKAFVDVLEQEQALREKPTDDVRHLVNELKKGLRGN